MLESISQTSNLDKRYNEGSLVQQANAGYQIGRGHVVTVSIPHVNFLFSIFSPHNIRTYTAGSI